MKVSIPADAVQAAIKNVEYHLFRGTHHMVCCLTLQNGYSVIGQSMWVDPDNFDSTACQVYARADAELNVARLLAFVQCEKLNGGAYEH